MVVTEKRGERTVRREMLKAHIPKSRCNTKNLLTTDESLVRVGSAVEREKSKNSSSYFFPNGGGEDKKKADVGKKGNDEHVGEHNAKRERKGTDKGLASLNLSKSLADGTFPKHLKGDLAADKDA